MNELPEFWRTEIWHPVSVHLPLVLLVMAPLFYIAGMLTRRVFWGNMGSVLLIIGTIGAWVAIYTGNLADGVVGRQICDPTVLETHEVNAWWAAYLFSAASVLVILEYFVFHGKFKKTFSLAVLTLLLTGSVFLSYAGHLGATLVYQQAAGVYTPSEDCSEFE